MIDQKTLRLVEKVVGIMVTRTKAVADTVEKIQASVAAWSEKELGVLNAVLERNSKTCDLLIKQLCILGVMSNYYGKIIAVLMDDGENGANDDENADEDSLGEE